MEEIKHSPLDGLTHATAAVVGNENHSSNANFLNQAPFSQAITNLKVPECTEENLNEGKFV